MSRQITVYGPQFGEKLLLLSQGRFFELHLSVVKEHFHLHGVLVSLKPLSLSHEHVKLEVVQLSGGEEGFLLDHDMHQFYKVSIAGQDQNSRVPLDKGTSTYVFSVLDIIRTLPLNSNLHVVLHNIKDVRRVSEIPNSYDGYVAFELPPSASKTAMSGMEQRNDCHPWTEYVTCSSDCFEGIVRFSRCAGHLRCINVDCPYYARMHYHNETQWKGRLKRCCPVGLLSLQYGNLTCKHCGQMPECVSLCPAVIYYCIPQDREGTTRCAIHLGNHSHPYEEGTCRVNEETLKEKVLLHAKMNPFTTVKQLQTTVAKDVILDMLMGHNEHDGSEIGDDEFAGLLDYVTPLSNRKRTEKCLEYAKRAQSITSKGLEAVLDLKHRCRYPFIHSVLFPGQLGREHQAHVFKMSTKGPGSGLDLINRMRPGGNLQEMWVRFDHVHRVPGWPTMSAHVYDPFMRELLTIATCEFRVEDRCAQIEFWKMLNTVVQQSGFPIPEFRGFMADEANANWIAVRTVYFGGAKKTQPDKERSCTFHWEQSMVRHTQKCIRPSSQEEHKCLCRKWRNAMSENASEICKNEIRKFWRAGHANAGEIPALETWLAWWDNRAFHWGNWFVSQDNNGIFIPTTNLSEAKHASMRASVGYKSQISLFEATGADMSLAILQSVNYNAYLKGTRSGNGPGMQDMVDRFYNHGAGTSSGKRLSDLAHSSMQEMGVPTCDAHGSSMDQRSVRRKRPMVSDPAVILENDSHRPEYVTVTVNKRQNVPRSIYEEQHESLVETRVPKTMWAIRRTEPGSKVTCFGKLVGQSGRCGRYINESDGNGKHGVPAPCFWGRRKYPGGTVEGNIWFCNTSNTHTWEVDEGHVIGPPGPALGVWSVDEGTCLQPNEVQMLRANGFVMAFGGGPSNSTPQNSSMGRVPSSNRPKYRDGKLVKWRSRLTKEFLDSIEKGWALDAQVIREAIIVCNESHVFYVATEGSRAKGVNYSISIADFPRCTCEGFQKRETKHLPYVPCKHMYYIFMNVLGLDHLAHDFIHQAALTKVELFQALGGRRLNVIG